MNDLSKHFYYADENSPEFSWQERHQDLHRERQRLMDSVKTVNITKIRHQVEREEARESRKEVIKMFEPIKVERVKVKWSVGMYNFSKSMQ